MNRLTFISAGTSDPQLLTLRAVHALQDAQLIVADPGARDLLRDVVPDDKDVVVVDGTLAQRKRALTNAVKAVPHTVRLISGDPVLDGVLALELQAMAGTAHIDVVPGITTAAAAAAFSGISLISGSAREIRVLDTNDPQLDWNSCADPRSTLVFTRGADNATRVFQRLLAAGRSPSTPFRIIRDIGTLSQRSIAGELGSASDAIDRARQSGDGIIIVGETVNAAVEWFERKPLFGWQVLIPRTKDPVETLEANLRSHGAATTAVATLSVEPPRTPQAMERAMSGIAGGRFGWIVFTCANSFNAVWEKLHAYGLDARAFAGVQLAAVGLDTVAAMQAYGLRADLVSEDTTRGLVDFFPEPLFGEEQMSRVLIPRADIATETLATALQELGWEVEEVTAFRTVRSAPPEPRIREAIKNAGFDVVVFTSAATVRNLIGIAGKPHVNTLIACIGPQSAKTAEEHGLQVDVVASEPTHEALVEALIAHVSGLQQAAFAAGQRDWRPNNRRAAGQRKAK